MCDQSERLIPDGHTTSKHCGHNRNTQMPEKSTTQQNNNKKREKQKKNVNNVSHVISKRHAEENCLK